MPESLDQDLAPKKKKGGLLKWIILLVVLLLLVGGGFAAWKFFIQPKFFGPKPVAENATNATAEAPPPAATPAAQPEATPLPDSPEVKARTLAPGELVALDPFIVNLADASGKRYLKLSLSVEVADKPTVADLQKVMPVVKDSILLLLSSKSYSDIATLEDKLHLKREIIMRLNQILGGPKVVDLFFSDFVVQ